VPVSGEEQRQGGSRQGREDWRPVRSERMAVRVELRSKHVGRIGWDT
jgi:hypothetical protein